MKTVQKEVHVTDDGKEFTDLTDAMTHEAALENEIAIDDFLDSLEDSTERAKSRIRNDLLKFLGFTALQASIKEQKKNVKAA